MFLIFCEFRGPSTAGPRFGFALQEELVAAAKAAAGSGLEKVSRNRIGIEVLGTGGHRILAL